MARRRRGWLAAGTLGAILSGAPSTAWALATGADPLAASRAAGALVGRQGSLVAAAAVHGVISLGWAAALAAALPRRRPLAEGAAAGLAIAALDLGVVGRRVPAIRRLPAAPQVADHVAFGVVVAATLGRRRAV